MNDDVRSQDDDVRTNAAARALDALESHEVEDIDAAARDSAALRDEIDGFSGTAAQLGLATRPVAPPAALRARLLAEIARTPQLPADAAATASTSASTDSSTEAVADVRDGSAATSAGGDVSRATSLSRESRPFSASIPIVPPADRTPAADASADAAAPGPAEARARSRWYARPGLVLGSAAAALALFAGGVAVGVLFEGDSPQVEAEASALAELYAAPDAQRRSADVEGDGTATLVWSEQLDRSVVVFDQLAPLPEDSVYEAWYINSAGTATPAGTFRTETDGLVYHLLDGSLGRGGTVGVTVEPEPGSEAPTTKPIVLLNRA